MELITTNGTIKEIVSIISWNDEQIKFENERGKIEIIANTYIKSIKM